MGRRVLAFKKAIVVFDNRVDTFKQAIIDLLSKDSDMVDLFLSQPAQSQEHEEVELILEGYKDGLHDLHLRINGLLVQISDTREFINTHLDEARNRIMRMSLMMEMSMLGVSTGTVISGIFGMNLKNGLEDIPYAFYATTASLVLFAIMIILALILCLRIIEGGKTSTKNYHVLRNFMAYVDDIVGKLRSCGNKSMMASEFESFMKKLVGQEVISDVTEETDLLFKIFDANRTGKIDPDEIRILTNSDVSKRRRKSSRLW